VWFSNSKDADTAYAGYLCHQSYLWAVSSRPTEVANLEIDVSLCQQLAAIQFPPNIEALEMPPPAVPARVSIAYAYTNLSHAWKSLYADSLADEHRSSGTTTLNIMMAMAGED